MAGITAERERKERERKENKKSEERQQQQKKKRRGSLPTIDLLSHLSSSLIPCFPGPFSNFAGNESLSCPVQSRSLSARARAGDAFRNKREREGTTTNNDDDDAKNLGARAAALHDAGRSELGGAHSRLTGALGVFSSH